MTINMMDLAVTAWSSAHQDSRAEDNGVRVKHLPTGHVVEVDSERAQHANLAKAMSELEIKINEHNS